MGGVGCDRLPTSTTNQYNKLVPQQQLLHTPKLKIHNHNTYTTTEQITLAIILHVGSIYQTPETLFLSSSPVASVQLTKLHPTLHSTIISTTCSPHSYSTTYIYPYHSPPYFFTKKLSMLPFCISPLRARFFDVAAD